MRGWGSKGGENPIQIIKTRRHNYKWGLQEILTVKSRSLDCGDRRHGVWVAIEFSHKLVEYTSFTDFCSDSQIW